jgi:uncharacterized protein YecA (UPF0149 family)
MELMNTPVGEKVAQVADDLIVRNMDFPGADAIADRLAAANPLSQIDEKSEVPPQAQMMIKGLQQKLEQAGKVINELQVENKYRLQLQDKKEEGATRRALMKETSDAHEREITMAQKTHDTEVYALTAQNVAEIQALAKLLTSHTDNGHKLRQMLQQFEHDSAMHDKEQKAKADESALADAGVPQ